MATGLIILLILAGLGFWGYKNFIKRGAAGLFLPFGLIGLILVAILFLYMMSRPHF